MKKHIKYLLTALVVVLSAGYVVAAPAYPHPIKVRQPDGTQLTIQMHGDEFFNYTTTGDGYNIVSRNGIYYYAELKGLELVPTDVTAKEPAFRGAEDAAVLGRILKGIPHTAASAVREENIARMMPQTSARSAQRRDPAINSGEPFKTLVILVNYSDVKFTSTTAQSDFSRMLNEPGYSDRNATGSAWDYYNYNSAGLFDPHFDVVGPIDYSKTQAEVGDRLSAVKDMVSYAVRQAVSEFGVNLNDYSNGSTIRDVFIYYAGHNAAEGNAGTIWPHRLSESFVVNGYAIDGYACTSEMRGRQSGSVSQMCGIGTFVHEFGHVLGWPDFYDTDYAENGSALDPSYFSVMAGGNYNDNGFTPPPLGAMERYMIGWMKPEEITQNGDYELRPVAENQAYMLRTDNPGEFFLLEYHNSGHNVYDERLAKTIGRRNMNDLVVYHVDSSENRVGGVRAKDLWMRNMLNCYSNHPCYKIVRSNNTNSPSYWMFPGQSGTDLLTAVGSSGNSEFLPWGQIYNRYEILGISPGANSITFNANIITSGNIRGTVKNSGGNAIPEATIVLTKGSTSKSLVALDDGFEYQAGTFADDVYRAPGILQYFIKADAKGNFSRSGIEEGIYNVFVSKTGYDSYSQSETIPISGKLLNVSLKASVNDASGIKFNTTTIAGAVGTEAVIDYEFVPAGSSASLEWMSSNREVAEVYDGGVVRIIGEGSAVITVKSPAFTSTQQCSVTGTPEISNMTVDLASDEKTAQVSWSPAVNRSEWVVSWGNKYDEEWGFHELVVDGGVTTVTIDKLMPSSDYTVYVNGKRADGNWGGKKETFTTSYAEGATGVSVDITSKEIFVNESFVITATVVPADAYNAEVWWISSDESIAAVDQNGNVVGRGNGDCIITARLKYGDEKAECRVSVTMEMGDLALIVNQNDAEIDWSGSSHEGEFQVTVFRKSNNTNIVNVITDETYLYVSDLMPGVEYIVSVTAKRDGGDGNTSEVIFTTEQRAHPFPSMKGIKGSYGVGEEIVLCIIDADSTIKSIVWMIDDKEAAPPRITLSAGNHKITALITNADGSVEKLNKHITVK